MIYDSSNVTVELREIVESGVKVWDFDYPSYYKGDEKTAFEQKVIDHFYFRQIGFETVGRFLHMFRSKVREIMPYYIQLYESEHIQDDVDPFDNYLLEETFERTVTDSKKQSSTAGLNQTTKGTQTEAGLSNVDTKGEVNEDKLTKLNDTPQGSVDNLDNYLTSATKEEADGDSHTETVTKANNTIGRKDFVDSSEVRNGSENSEQVEKYHIYRHGNIGVQTFGDELQKYRDVMLNIDMLVINELNCLFLGVY